MDTSNTGQETAPKQSRSGSPKTTKEGHWQTSISNERYTPTCYADSTRESFRGPITLDPASCRIANQFVRAEYYFTIVDNALALPWLIDGRPTQCFLNPPYGMIGRRSSVDIWAEYTIDQILAGNIYQLVFLCGTNHTNLEYVQRLMQMPHTASCITDHRIKFIDGDDPGLRLLTQPQTNNVFTYYGPNVRHFTRAFSRWGVIVQSMAVSSFAHAFERTAHLGQQTDMAWEKAGKAHARKVKNEKRS